jgi:hypothetical protein
VSEAGIGRAGVKNKPRVIWIWRCSEMRPSSRHVVPQLCMESAPPVSFVWMLSPASDMIIEDLWASTAKISRPLNGPEDSHYLRRSRR